MTAAILKLADPRSAEVHKNLIADLESKLALAREGRLTEWCACFIIDDEFVMSRAACTKRDAITYSSMLNHHMVEEMMR